MPHCTHHLSFSIQLIGLSQLTVKWSGDLVKGCPYKLNVAAASDASKVVVGTEELKAGVVGKKLESFIDTRRAGPGRPNK